MPDTTPAPLDPPTDDRFASMLAAFAEPTLPTLTPIENGLLELQQFAHRLAQAYVALLTDVAEPAPETTED